MNKEKIAILADSASDVPKEFVEKYNIYLAPLNIVYEDGEYVDGVDITAEEFFAHLPEEIPKTSLPSISTIQQVFDQIKKDGYKKVLAVAISSNLSGTYNAIKMVAEQEKDLESYVVDSKSVSFASGFNAIQAAKYIREGMTWEKLIQKVSEDVENTKVFYYVPTLEYMQKGGRIGRVASIIGSRLNIKPIISFNDEGITYAVAKVRGEKRSISKTLDFAINYIGDSENYNIAIVHADAKEKAEALRKKLTKRLPNANIFDGGQISPILGVHVGPGGLGVIVQKL
ncbi:MAG: DegV family protein [Atopostipes suicloacalis]|nr:DegV family protein [Atopostipes suicloacalis]